MPVFEFDPNHIGQSVAWTVETLGAAWCKAQMTKYEAKLEKEGIERENWEMIKANDDQVPSEDRLNVKEVLKGLWNVNGEYAVVEGECPVSRSGPDGASVLLGCNVDAAVRCVGNNFLEGMLCATVGLAA